MIVSPKSIALLPSTMFACGDNSEGELGLGDEENRNTFTAVPALPDGRVAKQVIAGGNHTMILAEDGTVFACGYNNDGQLGLGDNEDRNTFTAVRLTVRRDEQGKKRPEEVIEVVAKELVAGNHHTIIVGGDTAFGVVFACGWNYYGQLGLGDTQNRNTFQIVRNTNLETHRHADPEQDEPIHKCLPDSPQCLVSGGA